MDIIQRAAYAIAAIVGIVLLVSGFFAALTVLIVLLPLVAFALTLWLIVRSAGKNWGGSRPSDQGPVNPMFRE